MDRDRFDAFTRLFASRGSRRAALGVLFGAKMLGLALETEASKGKVDARGRGNGRSKGQGRSRARGKQRAAKRGKSHKDRQPRAVAEAANCCATGNCAPGAGRNLGKCCYQGQDLSGKSFRGANLGSASFAGATLTGADLRSANLDKTCLVDADLTGARLTGANTGTAIFCRTVMPDGSPTDSGCTKGTACCPTCNAANGCDPGEVCCGGRCRSGGCCTSADCPADEPICSRNSCGPCTGDAQCGSGRVCCNGICCPVGLRCIGNTCQEGCGGDSDCDANQVCCDQQCRDGDCCVGGDCGSSGNLCRDFTCRCGNGNACSGACCSQGDSAACRECCDSNDCSGNTPFCDASGVCVQCLQNGDCTTSDPCRDAVCDNGTCATTDKDNGESCQVGQASGVCCGGSCDVGAQCCTDAQCTNPNEPFCNPDGRCIPCRSSDDCDVVACQTATCTTGGQCEYDDQTNGTRCDDGGEGVCCGGACAVGAECCSNAQCTNPAAPVCDANGRCICPGSRATCNAICCAQGEVCDTSVTPNTCCTRTKNTCEAGVDCGDVLDGCGGFVRCGDCPQESCQTVACTDNACAYADAPEGDACQIDQGAGVCCDGQCQPGNCCTDTQCANPTPICLGNTCSACTADDQCGPNRTCCNGRCGTGGCCATNDQCGAGRVCCDGRCREGTCCTSAECRVPGTGGGTLVCRDNFCSPCTAHADCGPDHLCDLGDDPDRLGTCHVCDVLSNSQTDLLDVLERANSGQTIYICPGIHRFGGPAAIIDVPDLTLYGAGSGGDPEVDTILVPQLIGIANRRDDAKVMHLSISGGLEGSTVINGSNASLTLQDVALAGGRADSGGCVQNAGDLTLRDVTLSRCQATNLGGGIVNNGHITVEDVIIADCTAGEGGGIAFRGNPSAVASGTLERLTISRCVATGDGGGISGEIDGEVTLISSSIVACEAAGDGGGIRILVGGVLRLVGSSVSGCTAEGEGGGIFNERFDPDNTEDPPDPDNPPDPEPRLILDLSVVSGCTAGGRGGGIFNDGLMILRNETEVRGNRSATEPEGQGIYNQGIITCETVTPPPNSDITVNPRVCGNPSNTAATLATNCRDTGSSCNNASRPVCLGGAAPGSGACSNACTTNAECRFGVCCGGFCQDFGECCGDADCTDPDLPTCINNFCAACIVDGQCGAGRVCCDDGICRECCDMGDCPLSARRCCDGVCKGCCDSLDCPLNRPICTAEQICVACQSDGQCVAAGRGDVCCNGQCRTGQC